MTKFIFPLFIFLAGHLVSAGQVSFLDSTFGIGGHILTPVGGTQKSVLPRGILAPDGKIIVREDRIISSGIWMLECWVHRFLPDGTIDSDFGTNGSVLLNPGDLAASLALEDHLQLLPGGKILTSYRSGSPDGLRTEMLQLNADGTPDTSFGNNGRATFTDPALASGRVPLFRDAVSRSDGKIVVIYNASDAGFRDLGFRLLESNGTPVSGYDTIQWQITPEEEFFRKAIAIPGNRVLVCGNSGAIGADSNDVDMAIFRFNGNLDRDNTFGTNGMITQNVTGFYETSCDMEVLPDGKILVCGLDYEYGHQNLWVTRFLNNGDLDITFGQAGKTVDTLSLTTPIANEFYYHFSLDLEVFPDNKFIIGGIIYRPQTVPFVYEPGYVHFTANGMPDTIASIQSNRVFFPIIETGINYNMSTFKALPDRRVLSFGLSTTQPRTLSMARFLPEPNAVQWFRDQDNDGYGNDNNTIFAANPPNGFIAFGGDCNDFIATTHPGATEICNGIDDDCDGIVDNLPTAICAEALVIPLENNGQVSIAAEDVYIQGMDDCSQNIVQISIDTAFYTCADLGENTVTLTVTNDLGFSNTCQTPVTVVDKKAPLAQCLPQITVLLDNNGTYTLTGQDLNNGSTDNCGITDYQTDYSLLTTSNIGTFTATLTVTDVSGNAGTCTTIVTVTSASGTDAPVAGGIRLIATPNPAKGQVTIYLSGAAFEPGMALELLDCLGRIVQKTTVDQPQHTINVETLPAGIYTLRASGNTGMRFTGQLIKG